MAIRVNQSSVTLSQSTWTGSRSPSWQTLMKERSQRTQGKFAYAFVIAGCTEHSCLGYILNMLAASYSLRSSSSTADIVVKVRMSSTINATRLPSMYEDWIKMAGIKLTYLDKVNVESFGSACLEKFRILEMTQYDRILFLDADLLPICNTDWIFNESFNDDGLFSDTVVFNSGVAPATAAFFLMTPQEGEFQRILDIVERQRNKSNAKFDYKLGWGHVIDVNDTWRGWIKKGNLWNMYGAWADQGVLYHYVKYVRLDYTQVRSHPDIVESWKDITHEIDRWSYKNITIIPVDDRYLGMVDVKVGKLTGCGIETSRRGYTDFPPYSEFHHYAGGKKPWNRPLLSNDAPKSLADAKKRGKAEVDKRLRHNLKQQAIWFYYLGKANETFNLELPSNITVSQGNPLGYGPQPNELFNPKLVLPRPSHSNETMNGTMLVN